MIMRQTGAMRITARVDYAVRAMTVLACATDDRPVKAEAVAEDQGIPLQFLLKILAELRLARLVTSRRGQQGGFALARPADDITVADVIRAVEGPLADVHGAPPEELAYVGSATALREVWIATRLALRDVLEEVSIAHIASGVLPDAIGAQLTRPGADRRR